MKSGLRFILAARQCEISELERLAQTGELVGLLGRFAHALQRERGLSNVYIASHGQQMAQQRCDQQRQCESIQQDVLLHFDRLDAEAIRMPNGARLYGRIAVLLHGLEGLHSIREQIAGRSLAPEQATAAFVRLIANLLAVVFEAADSAGDPDISRALFAMFNFMQGKEFAGQERALGGGVFASGRIDTAVRAQWQHLIDIQQSCFQLFLDFCEPALIAVDHASQDPEVLAEIERMRRTALVPSTRADADPALTPSWYEACTRRIDGMKLVEDALAANLRQLCERQIAVAREGLRDQRVLLDDLLRRDDNPPQSTPGRYGPHLERSILEMVQEQSRRLQAVSDELDHVKAALNDRKIVERAKGLLMAHRQLSESESHKLLRSMAMNQNRRLVDVAEAVLTMAHMLPR